MRTASGAVELAAHSYEEYLAAPKSYVVINTAQDGTHVSVYKTLVGAVAELRDLVGSHPGDWSALDQVRERGSVTHYSDWGNRVTIEERPAGWTARRERALKRAYDNREMGIATKRETAFLDKYRF